ncbi:MAG TPA: thiolase family protein [Nitrospiria bacterium]|jgi:acetyl-CoA C-acetyltransferase
MQETLIVSAVRTPIGSFNGVLSSVSATVLGSKVIAEALQRAHVRAEEVDEVIMGNVLSAGLGQAPARQAAIGAGLPHSVGAVTINKVCGSGLKAVIMASQAIRAGDADIIVAGGMESMNNAPYLLEKARWGFRMGDGQIVDSMIRDGLWDVYHNFHMGSAAELCARQYKISREEADQYAISSFKKALEAQGTGAFKEELVPVWVERRKLSSDVIEDEGPSKFNSSKMVNLKPIFKKNGIITAANASPISDGASALTIMSEQKAKEINVSPLARIVGYASHAHEPKWFTTAPVMAIRKLLQKTKHTISDVDLFEINEAFSVVSLVANRELNLPPEKVNVRGGAIALGHPIGASGARILTTLVHSLVSLNQKRGVACLCIGGGEAIAIMLERE